MKYTPRLESAIKFAAQRHDGQLRVERERLPYITHLMSVAILVSNHSDDEDCIIAALLHDSLEDTNTTLEEIAALFGGDVAGIVHTVTERKVADWKESKLRYIEQLQQGSEKALLVAAADKIHNIASRISLVKEVGPSIFASWRHTPAEYHWYHESVYTVVASRLSNTIVSEFKKLIDEERALFGA